ncbi:N-acetylmuramoyl-L-alanine amidase [Candidatus Sumerlaeota bacterium]|nr:N-acetylmuramoyl-L-alanine amidase [Candidatus Sumerlaeota bacterium]
MPKIIPHAQWHKTAPVGFPAQGTRKNIAPGESLQFKNLKIELVSMNPATPGDPKSSTDTVDLKLSMGEKSEQKKVNEGDAFNWEGFHIAVLAAHTKKGELGFGLTEFEITTIDSIPPEIAASTKAGNAASRARIPHKIEKIMLHHAGDPKPITPKDDPVKKLQNLQAWGEKDKKWWDVPYHLIVALDGAIYEGRDWHYIGETNTKYNPTGYLQLMVMGNYELQEPNEAQINAVTDIMAWAVQEFNVPLDKIYGHRDLAETACPGKHLYRYLKEGAFHSGIKQRLEK